jgi:hypothetical protein
MFDSWHQLYNRRRLRRGTVLAALLLMWLRPAQSQVDSGVLLGQVTDPSSAVIVGAKVTLLNEGTGLTATTTTDSRGSYIFSPVRIGAYTVSIEHPGFAKSTHLHVTVNIQQQALVNIMLAPGQVEQSVDVSTAPPVLQTQDASVGQVMSARAIRDLPLNGRNYIFLAQLSAGVTFGQHDSRGENGNGRFAANGTRPTQNNYLLDGIDNNSSIISRQNGKDFVVLTPVDALSEFKIQTNSYSAEFGRAAGAVLNATVKSGTNQFHGDAWEFLRNNKLDAADFFENAAGAPQSEFRRNQFGFTQGGPVRLPHIYDGRNRTFFFVDYEGTRIRQGNPDVSTVPTLAERESGYSNFADLPAGQTGSRSDVLGRSFPSGTIFDPATTRTASGSYVRDPFPGNVIPASRLNANAIKLLQLLPAPNGPGILSNYTSTPIFQDDTNGFDIRIDQVFSDRDQMFGRYSYSFLHRIHPGPFPGVADGGDSLVNSNLDDRSQNAVLGETHLFGPTLVNEFRIGLNREHALWLQPYGDVMGIPAQFGIEGIPQTAQNGGLPRLNVGSLSHFGSWGFLPSDKYGTTPQITDDLTFTHGSHTIKTGIMAQRILFPFAQPPQSRGLLSYSGVFTSVINKTDGTAGIAQMLLNPTSSSNIAGANQVQLSNFHSHDLRRNYLGAYIQDDWKLSSRLTVNLGVRWDYFAFMHDRFGDNANFIPGGGFAGGTLLIPSVRQDLLPATYTAILAKDGIRVQGGGLDVGRAQKTNFAPRIGFAYQLTSKLVVRAGYGMFFGGAEELGGSPLLTENFPFEYTVTRTSLTPQTPITADNSIGLLETSFQNLSINPATINVSGIPLIGFEYRWKTPYTQSENLTLQYQLGSASTFSIGYIGSNSRHIPIILSSNPVLTLLPPGTNSTPYVPYPDTAISGGNYTTTQGSSNYNSLQTTYEKRFTNGLSLLANFTWAKILTNAHDPLEGTIGGYRAPYLPGFGIQQDVSLADFDVRRAAHISGSYELPFGPGKVFASQARGVLAQLIGGWSMNWILTVQDGQPFTVGCPTATSTGFGCNGLRVAGQNPYAGSHDVNHFLNAAAFTNPISVARIGQTDVSPLGGSATQVSGPPFRRLDLSFFKQFKTSESTYVEFRAEAFNLTNTPNFSNPSSLNFLDTTSFGRITSTRDNPNDPRELQFGLKFYW